MQLHLWPICTAGSSASWQKHLFEIQVSRELENHTGSEVQQAFAVRASLSEPWEQNTTTTHNQLWLLWAKNETTLATNQEIFWGITENKKIQIRHGCHWPCTNKACPAGTEVVEGRHSWKSKLWPPGQVNSLRHFLFYAREVQFWGPWAF